MNSINFVNYYNKTKINLKKFKLTEVNKQYPLLAKIPRIIIIKILNKTKQTGVGEQHTIYLIIIIKNVNIN